MNFSVQSSLLLGPRLSSLLALLAFLEGDAEAELVGTLAGVGSATPSRTEERAGVEPRATASDPVPTRSRTGRVDHQVDGGIGCMIPVRDPLPHISMHIEKAPRVGRVQPHITSL